MSSTSALEQIIEINKSIVKLPLTQEAVLELLGMMNLLAERIAEIEERLYMRDSGLN